MTETHIMLDLETMSTRPNAAIVAIGACVFDPYSFTRPTEFFDVGVSLQSSVDAGLHVDPSTILWWLKQSETARAKTFDRETLPVLVALHNFSNWLSQFGYNPFVWGNGATFDNVVIRSAYHAYGSDAPWSFRNDRCYRTMTGLVGDVGFERVGELHNAIDDAISQAVYLQKVMAVLGLSHCGSSAPEDRHE